jgi:heme-degrading monooxygenase HmoA
MQKVLIDTFVVPAESKTAFLEEARKVQGFLKTIPGFVDGFLYVKTEGASRYNFLTTAVWESEKAFENAKAAVAKEFQRQGLNPQETVKRLKIESERAVYERFPY